MLISALAVAAVLIGLDQITKWLAVEYLMPMRSVQVIYINGKEVLNFTYLQNTGAAFSILEGKQILLIIIPSAFIITLFYLLFTGKIRGALGIWASALIISGGIGNLIDRILNGYVVDFIDFRIIHFAVFNVADICAVVGAFMFMAAVFIEDKRKSVDAASASQVDGLSFKGLTSDSDE